MNETLIKVAQSWCSATPEARLLLIEDYLAQLETLCRPEEQQLLVRLYDEILARLDSLLGHLQQDPQYLIAAIETWSQNHPDMKLLLVIDQFEELITASHEGQTDSREDDETGGDRTAELKQWQPFLEMLRGAISGCPEQWRVVLTLRSDFEPRFLDSALKSYWKDGRFPVRAMNSDELRQAIEGPALKQALYFEPPELVGKLIDEVGQMPGALPLLSFTLSELYIKLHGRWVKDNASDRALRIKDYEELGGVAGALTRRATEEYYRLIEDEYPRDEYRGGFGKQEGKAYQATMQRVMLRMVAIGGGSLARRRVPEPELVYPSSKENGRVKQVIARLVKARLLVKGQEIGEPYVEPAHDFLMRGWDSLQEWIKDNLESLVLQERLTPAANDWERNNYIVGLLLPDGDRLNQLEILLQHSNNWFNETEKQFIEKSIEHRDFLRRQAEALQVTSELQAQATKVSDLLNLTMQPLDALVLAIDSMGKNLRKLPHTLDSTVQSLIRATEASREGNVLYEHNEAVCCVAYSPSGELIVSGGYDLMLRLWDAQGNPKEPENFFGHRSSLEKPFMAFEDWIPYVLAETDEVPAPLPSKDRAIWSVAFSPDSKTIASGRYDGTIRLWNLDGYQVAKLEGHEGIVYSVAFSPDGEFIASSGIDKTIRLWNLKGEAIGKPFKGHKGAVYSVAFNPEGQWIISGSEDETVRIWNLKGEAIGKPFKGHKGAVYSVAFNPIGKLFVSGSQDGKVRLWDSEDRSLIDVFEGYTNDITSVACSRGGKLVVVGSRDGAIHLWYPNFRSAVSPQFSSEIAPTVSIPLSGHRGTIKSLAFSPDTTNIVSCSEDKSIRVWDLQNIPLAWHFSPIFDVSSSPDNRYIVSGGSFDCMLVLYDIQDNKIKKIHPFLGHESFIWSVAFSPDGKLIASGSEDNTIRLWDLEGHSIGKPFNGHDNSVLSVKFSPDGQSIISGGDDGKIYIWDLQGNRIGEMQLQWSGSLTSIASVDICSNGKFAISGGIDGVIRLWDFQEHTLISQFRKHKQPIFSVIFSPNGQLIASCDEGGTIQLLDLNGNSVSKPFKGHEGTVATVAFSPNGQLIASGGQDKIIRLWDLQGNLIHLYQGHKDNIASVNFSSDGKFIISGSHDQTIRLWHFDYKYSLQAACNRLRHHPVLKNPRTEIEKSACETCQEYVWSKSDSMLT